MIDIFLLLGSNIEPRESFLEEAEFEILSKIGALVKASKIYQSAPWGFADETHFLNKVLIVNTNLEAEEILEIIFGIEQKMGRIRNGNDYSSRNIDIDILYFGDVVLQKSYLQIPHPRLHLRRFTLLPLVEIAPDFTHPTIKLTNKDLLRKCDDPIGVTIFKVPGVEV